MTVDYTIDRAEAADMIAEFGQAVTLTRCASGPYDPATSSSAITESTQAGKGVILPLAPMRKSAGTSIPEGAQQLLLSSLKTDGSVLTVPHVDDTVTLASGEVMALLAVDPLSPAGVAVLYDCVVKDVTP
jgi:hypothetical protein